MLRKQDAIIAVLPPSLFMLGVAIVARKVKVIGIVHDLQAVHFSSGKSALRKLFVKLIKSIEKRAFHACDCLIYLSTEMKEEAAGDYSLESYRARVLYPFVTMESFRNKNRLDEYFSDSSVNVVYSGAFGEKQAPYKLLEVARALVEKDARVKFIIFSNGPIFEELKGLNRHPSILFSDLVHAADLGELLIRSDIQVIPQARGTSKGSLPSKLPNILASGTTAFCVTDSNSELAGLLSAQKSCFVSHTWDVRQNVDLLVSIISSGLGKVNRVNDLGLYQKDSLGSILKEEILR
jgi:colanic acid biosynthesis glycosyl transferase WcaI